MKSALVIGATGLVGRSLVNQLLEDPEYEMVKIFTRRSTGLHHSKLSEHLVDFETVESWKTLVSGDVLFSCLGTTLKQAGSKSAQYNIDFNYQFNVARAAADNQVEQYILISSAGADPESMNFYSRMKGRLESAVRGLSFQSIYLLRPSLLTGIREKERKGEKIAYYLISLFNRLGMFRRYKPVSGETVASAMIRCAHANEPGTHILPPNKSTTLNS